MRVAGTAPCLSVLGTASHVGKSIVTTALCRYYARRGRWVMPFKAQNLSNNSGVTPEGLEMGRAQIVQAEAAGISPHVDMNPVLLKPTGDLGSQVVLMGRALTSASATALYQDKEVLFTRAHSALGRLRQRADLVVMEGAGSCAEVNLMAHDIVNLRMAEAADAPVILVADIHRGGVFAQLVGTLACLDKAQQARIAGFIINRFRGDIEIFKDGVRWIEERTAKPVFGVLPWYSDFVIEAEDSVVIENPDIRRDANAPDGRPAVAVIRLPHISNFTDFETLEAIEAIAVTYLERPRSLEGFKAVILPGSKNTRGDLAWMHDTGWTKRLQRYVDQGGHILGICGGYQILGRRVVDPDGLEGRPGETAGLDLLPVETELKAPKTTSRTLFSWGANLGEGYEIHMGRTRRFGGRPLFKVHSRNQAEFDDDDGCRTANDRVMGTYMHGLFDTPGVIRQWLAGIGIDPLPEVQAHGPVARQQAYDQLADHFRAHIDMTAIDRLIADAAGRSSGDGA